MSDQEIYSEYLYFTITHPAELNPEQIYKKYKFENMHQASIAHHVHNTISLQSDLRHIQFEIGNSEDPLDFDQYLMLWFNLLLIRTKVLELPPEYTKTLHLTTRGSNHQNAGFHLSHKLLRYLSNLNCDFCLHGYLDQQEILNEAQHRSETISSNIQEYTYFWIESNQYTATELQHLLPELKFIVDFNQGISQRKQRKLPNSTRSSLSLKSKLAPTSFQLEEHLQDVISQMYSYQSALQTLFFDENIKFGINATGYLDNPHHRQISAATIKQLFLLGVNLDVDYYFL